MTRRWPRANSGSPLVRFWGGDGQRGYFPCATDGADSWSVPNPYMTGAGGMPFDRLPGGGWGTNFLVSCCLVKLSRTCRVRARQMWLRIPALLCGPVLAGLSLVAGFEF